MVNIKNSIILITLNTLRLTKIFGNFKNKTEKQKIVREKLLNRLQFQNKHCWIHEKFINIV